MECVAGVYKMQMMEGNYKDAIDDGDGDGGDGNDAAGEVGGGV